MLLVVRQLRSLVETEGLLNRGVKHADDPFASSEVPGLTMFTSGHRGYAV